MWKLICILLPSFKCKCKNKFSENILWLLTEKTVIIGYYYSSKPFQFQIKDFEGSHYSYLPEHSKMS